MIDKSISSNIINKLILNFGLKITSILKENMGDNLISICLFGSAAKATLRRGSDIDLLVALKSAPSSYHKRGKMILPLLDDIRGTPEYKSIEELNAQLEPSFLLLTTQEIESHPAILIDMSYEGLILYDNNDFLKHQLLFIRERLTELKAVKKSSTRGYYWLLKPDLKAGERLEV